MHIYDKGNAPIDMESLKGRECFGGLDLASTNDIAALVLVFPPDQNNDKYIFVPWFWIPADSIPERVRQHKLKYDVWVKQGHLNATDGSIIHYEFIEQKILELNTIYKIKELAFDEWGATQMIQRLEDMSKITYIKFRQGFKSLSPPSKEFHRLVLDEKVQHGGHPVLRWMFENVYIETDSAANIKPSKIKSEEKIDGAVSAIMALDRAIRYIDKPQGGLVIIDTATGEIRRNGQVVVNPDKPKLSEKEEYEIMRKKMEWDAMFGDD